MCGEDVQEVRSLDPCSKSPGFEEGISLLFVILGKNAIEMCVEKKRGVVTSRGRTMVAVLN